MKRLLVLSLFITACSAYAFTLNNSAVAKFHKNEVTINVENSTECANIGITNQELLDIAGEAADEFWNRAPTSRLKLRKGSLVTKGTFFHTGQMCESGTDCTPTASLIVDNDILISCNSNGSSTDPSTNFPDSRILALTLPNNINGSTIYGALILINDRTNNQFKSKSRHEKLTIIAHEMGHTFGLGHSPVTDSLMYYAHNENRNYLGQDDIDGVSYLYPANQPNFGGCGTIDTGSKNKQSEAFLVIVGMLLSIGLFSVLKSKRSSSL